MGRGTMLTDGVRYDRIGRRHAGVAARRLGRTWRQAASAWGPATVSTTIRDDARPDPAREDSQGRAAGDSPARGRTRARPTLRSARGGTMAHNTSGRPRGRGDTNDSSDRLDAEGVGNSVATARGRLPDRASNASERIADGGYDDRKGHDMSNSPTANRSNGRDTRGRFTTGNRGGPGNPRGKTVAKLQAMIRACVSDADLRAIIGVLVEEAKGGSLPACREVLDRLVGKPGPAPEPSTHDADRLPIGVWITTPEDRREPPDRAA